MRDVDVEAFISALSPGARLLRSSDADFPEMNQLWNSYYDRVTPEYIVLANNIEDVVLAVNFARDSGIEITPRAGRHNLAGLSSVKGGMVVDLRHMTRISVDEAAGTLTGEGGLKFGAIDDYLWKHHPGHCIQGGMDPSIGYFGAHLGVGHGWRQREFGTGTDNIVAAKVVLADGSVVTASREEHPDLFFALRGAGPNFGIVVELSTRLLPVDREQKPEVRQGFMWWPLEKAEAVFQALVDAGRRSDFPDDLMWVPELIFVDEQAGLRLSHVHYAGGDAARAEPWESLLESLISEHGGREILPWQWVTHLALQKEFVNLPPRMPWYTSGGFSEKAKTMDVFRTLVKQFAAVPNNLTSVLLIPYGGALARRDVTQTANPAGPQDIEWLFMFWSLWQNGAPDDGEAVIAWTRETYAAMRQNLRYGYANGTAFDQCNSEYARFIYGENYDKLAQLKAKYDPGNLFHHNINIAPA